MKTLYNMLAFALAFTITTYAGFVYYGNSHHATNHSMIDEGK